MAVKEQRNGNQRLENVDRSPFFIFAKEKQPMDLLGGTLYQHSSVRIGNVGYPLHELVWLGFLFVYHCKFQTYQKDYTYQRVIQQDLEDAFHLRPSHRVGRQAIHGKSFARFSEA